MLKFIVCQVLIFNLLKSRMYYQTIPIVRKQKRFVRFESTNPTSWFKLYSNIFFAHEFVIWIWVKKMGGVQLYIKCIQIHSIRRTLEESGPSRWIRCMQGWLERMYGIEGHIIQSNPFCRSWDISKVWWSIESLLTDTWKMFFCLEKLMWSN